MGSRSMFHHVCEVLAGWLRGPVALDPDLSDHGWKALLTAARVHGIGPRLAAILEDATWVPVEIAKWIELEAELNRQRVGLLRSEGAEILGAAANRNIDVLPLKGLALAGHISRLSALPTESGVTCRLEQRPMADLDLLVRPAHAAALHQTLIELGYRRMVSKAKHDEYLPHTGRHVASREHEHPDNPRPVEVHRLCGESFAGTRCDLTDGIWSSARFVAFGDFEVPVPGVRTVWTHLLLHASWQWWFGGGRMVQLLDLVELLPAIPDPAAAIAEIDPRIALLALSPTDRLLPKRLPAGLIEDLERRAGKSTTRLAVGLEPVGSSHLTTYGRSRLLRILQLYLGRPRALARAIGYVFAPGIDEMLINHDRVPQGPARAIAYPILWLWHLANIVGRA